MNDWTKPLGPWLKLAGIVLVVFALHAGKEILAPVAFALLLTFTLAPATNYLQRLIGRVASVAVVVVLAFTLLGVVSWAFTSQFVGFASELPAYRQNIRDKIDDIREASRGGSLEKVQEAVRGIQEEISRSEETAQPVPEPEPIQVVEADDGAGLLGLTSVYGLADVLASAALIVVLVVFMLLDRTDLRNRFILLLGSSRLTVATRALDEAGSRISRYLSRQALINGTFGLGVGLGLYALGVPYALLWGCFAAVMRFAPYVGPWIGAIAPFLVSMAVFPDWTRPLMVAGLFLLAELFTNIVMETLLYAGAAGVSTVGLLVALACWTWIWGPLGLVMGTPLTVCLVVMSKYVPSMGFLATLLGDESPLDAEAAYYQRLLARDRDEAAGIVETFLGATDAPEKVFDELIVPALCFARRDIDAGHLPAKEESWIARSNARMLDDIVADVVRREGLEVASTMSVLGCPASGEADELALRCFRQLLNPFGVELEILSPNLLSSELVELVAKHESSIVCVAALPPGELHHARYLCKRLRAACPDLRILVGRWGPPGLGGDGAEALLAAGADAVGATLLETRAQLLSNTTLQPTGLQPTATGAA